MSASKHLFYNGKTLATIKADESHTRLISANDMPLSQVDSGQANTYLLAINEAKSILAAHQSHELRQLSYNAYGDQQTSNPLIKLGYNGEPRNGVGFYLLGNGNRAYSPNLMRFLSPDRIGIFLIGNFNSYAYCSGDPINRTDRSGNLWQKLKPLLRALRLIKPEGTKQYNSDLIDKNLIHAKLDRIQKDINATNEVLSNSEIDLNAAHKRLNNHYRQQKPITPKNSNSSKNTRANSAQHQTTNEKHKNEIEYLNRKTNELELSIEINEKNERDNFENLKNLTERQIKAALELTELNKRIALYEKLNKIRGYKNKTIMPN